MAKTNSSADHKMGLLAKIKNLSLFDKLFIISLLIVSSFVIYTLFRKSTYIIVSIRLGEPSTNQELWTRPWVSNLFHNGMAEKDGLGRIAAEVVGVQSYNIAAWSDRLTERKVVYLKLKLRTVYSTSSNQYTYKGLPVLVGNHLEVYLDNIDVKGIVTSIEGVKSDRVKKTILVEVKIEDKNATFLETSGTDLFVADALTVGQEITDDQGNQIMKIVEKRVENAKRSSVNSNGQATITTNPLKKDVYLALSVNVEQYNGRYYMFDDVPVLVNNYLPINTQTISILPIVTKISEVNQ